MLYSQKLERGRRFTLALRAGIPVLILIFLVIISTIDKDLLFKISLKDGILIAAITFITIYFIYFLMNLSVQETLLDGTTQTFTKKAFIEKLESNHPASLACLNIQNLASLNENYSSEQIDTLLFSISRKLDQLFAQNGLKSVLISRNRGSEFLIALNEDATQIQSILETMTRQHSTINNIEIDYEFAIITNTHQDYEKTIIQLRDIIASQISDAHQEKEQHTAIKDSKELSNLEQAIITSIKEKMLILSFRPLYNMRNKTIDTYEIAVKLRGYDNEDILPRVYLPIVNRLGMGREYDLILAKQLIALLPLVGNSIAFTFNLSPFSLRDSLFQKQFFALLENTPIDASRLIIQLYERKTHHDLSGYLTTLKSYRAKGLRICIDNFGSSSTSLEYMKHFKFDMIQFDRDYSTNLEDETTYAILDSFIKMLHNLGVKTIAKWVDKDAQKEKLETLGVDYIQGFGVDKPLTEASLIELYNQ